MLNLANIDVENFLEALEVENLERATVDEFIFSCPFPGHNHGDSSPSAYMNTGEVDEDKTSLWYCHGCKRKGNAVTFLAEHENISKMKAQRWLREQYDSSFREPKEGTFSAEWDAHFEKLEMKRKIITNEPLEEYLLDQYYINWDFQAYGHSEYVLDKVYYMFDRGFNSDTLNDWQIGWSQRDERITIPIRDNDGSLVGFKGRAIDAERVPKYKLLGDLPTRQPKYGYPMYDPGKIVFGLYRAMSTDLILVEGELNVVAMHQLGYTNTVGLGGSNLTDHQIKLIKWHADSVILFFDSDRAGNSVAANAIEALEPFMPVRIVDSHEGDPADVLCGKIDITVLQELLDSTHSSFQLSLPF